MNSDALLLKRVDFSHWNAYSYNLTFNAECLPTENGPTVTSPVAYGWQDSSESNGGVGGRPQDPISHLVQLQQARKEKEPVFTVVSERGIPRQPEFVVQVPPNPYSNAIRTLFEP